MCTETAKDMDNVHVQVHVHDAETDIDMDIITSRVATYCTSTVQYISSSYEIYILIRAMLAGAGEVVLPDAAYGEMTPSLLGTILLLSTLPPAQPECPQASSHYTRGRHGTKRTGVVFGGHSTYLLPFSVWHYCRVFSEAIDLGME
jgi:hypothetical protein